MQINEVDLNKYRAFKSIIDGSVVELKGDAVILAASLRVWFDGLEARFEESLKPKSRPKPKPLKQPIKKV